MDGPESVSGGAEVDGTEVEQLRRQVAELQVGKPQNVQVIYVQGNDIWQTLVLFNGWERPGEFNSRL